MVRNYKRKTERQQWSEEAMKQAVQSVIDGSMGYKKASAKFNVPRTTLGRHVKNKRENPDYEIKKTMGCYTCVFNEEQENKLVDYLTNMESQLFGLTVNELRQLAYQLAELNNLPHPFGDDGKAGMDWVRGFLTRHPDIKLKRSEAMSEAKSIVFN